MATITATTVAAIPALRPHNAQMVTAASPTRVECPDGNENPSLDAPCRPQHRSAAVGRARPTAPFIISMTQYPVSIAATLSSAARRVENHTANTEMASAAGRVPKIMISENPSLTKSGSSPTLDVIVRSQPIGSEPMVTANTPIAKTETITIAAQLRGEGNDLSSFVFTTNNDRQGTGSTPP